MSSYLIDSHAHLHDDVFTEDPEEAVDLAVKANVMKIICIGTDLAMSRAAIKFAQEHANIWATVGLHPHDAKKFDNEEFDLKNLLGTEKVVAVGEVGLDYYYQHSSVKQQQDALRQQLEWARDNDYPVSLHLRGSKQDPTDAFKDVWPIWDLFPDLKGVVHSFSATRTVLDQILERDLFVALNGIVTFSKDPEHRLIVKDVPLDKLILETDSPYLTPAPFRGKINQPKYVGMIADFIADIKGLPTKKIAKQTSVNSEKLFNI